MNRLENTVRLVAASLKNNPHTQIADVPDLIRAIHAAMPADAVRAMPAEPVAAPEPETQQEAPQEAVGDEPEADAPKGRVSWEDALAASRARFGGQSEAEAEEETEAHAS